MYSPRFVRRAAALHDELAGVADIDGDPRWWLVAAGVAMPWPRRARRYLSSDGEPAGDTFIGFPTPPLDPDALAEAAHQAIRELDGSLPDQRLAVTIQRGLRGAEIVPSRLDTVAFVEGDRVKRAGPGVPFVTVSTGEEPIETARHGHRRAWSQGAGPWLGIGRAGGLTVISTCHMVVDGYGHTRLAARIVELAQQTAAVGDAEPVPPVPGAIPLSVHWREVPRPARRILELAYRLGIALHRLAGNPAARFSPTFQVPVAPGSGDDPMRVRRRVIPAIVSVRFSDGSPEPFDVFAARTRQLLARESTGEGLTSQLLAAMQAVPVPLAVKRSALGAERSRLFGNLAEVIGGRACLSKLRLDGIASPPAVAVSSAAQLASDRDRLGGCVLTLIETASGATVTLCGTGTSTDPALLDEIVR
jgi:hypothetical protein